VRSWRAAAVAVLGFAAFGAGFAALLTVRVARIVVTPPPGLPDQTRILAFDAAAGTVTVETSEDALLPGRYGLWFSSNSGHARLGEIVARTEGTVTRRVLGVDFGDLAGAMRGRFSSWFFLTPRDLGHPIETVMVETTLGAAPAWVIESAAESTSWVVQVHGRTVKRSETLRAVDAFRNSGRNALLISWRNDGDAPASPDGRYGLGATEWRDVEAGIRFAMGRGATDVVIMGWSMGGSIALQAATESSLRDIVSGIVLESPVVAWGPTLQFQARAMCVPRLVRVAALALLGSRRLHRITGQGAPIDFARLDFVRRSGELSVPILLMHSDDDGYVPSAASRALAAARPDIVTFHSWQGARHTRLWNHDPERFEEQIGQWLARLRE
jgi:alpha-beta hydrolase superfamily lysophospholipase